MPSRYPFAFLLFLTAFCPTSVRGVALSLLSGTSTQGSLLSLNVVLNSVAGSEPAALQWTINYPASNISSILIAPGPQATSASKSLTCRNIYGSESCLLSGLNTNRIPNGVVAVATLQLSPSTVGVPPGIELIKALGVSSFNASIPVATTTSITVATPIPQVKALQCSPTSVTGPAVETCTVTLTASAPSPGVNVSIGTAATSVTITNPGSVTVPAGQTIAVFSLNVSGAFTASTVLVTGSENGSSAVASFTVTPPASSLPSIMGLQCFPFFVTAPATVNCTVTLTASAPSPGLSLSIGIAATGVTITNPDSVTVPAGQTSTAFSLNVIGATTVSTVMVTASESGSSSVASFSVTPPEISLPSTIRVHAGGLGYVDGDGNIWTADEGYSGGSTYGTSAPISATSSPYLYQTERFASGTLHYEFSVPNGSYAVKLKFAEIYFAQPGRRVFNVSINGQQVLANFDIVSQTGGPYIAVDRQYMVNVTSGQVAIDFYSVVNNAKINAIEIVPGTALGTAFTPIRVAAGALSAYTDPLGNVWSADHAYSGGNQYATTAFITNATRPVLYQHERWQQGGFTYTFTVPNGTHTVTLKFAEIYFTQSGERLFNVLINGQTVLSNFDIVAQAGGALRALDKSFSVDVTGGTVTIQFTPGLANNPKVNAIEIRSNVG